MGIALAGDAGAETMVDEPAGVFGHQAQSSRAAGGAARKTVSRPAGAHDLDVGAGFFDAGVDEQASVDAGGFGVGGELFRYRSA